MPLIMDKPMLRGPRRARPGFTIVELMAVIGIIVLLMGIAVPTLKVVREEARSTSCRTALREIGLGISGGPVQGWVGVIYDSLRRVDATRQGGHFHPGGSDSNAHRL